MELQVREWKEAMEMYDLRQNPLEVDSTCCLKGNSGIFRQVSKQDNPGTCKSFVKSWLKGEGREQKDILTLSASWQGASNTSTWGYFFAGDLQLPRVRMEIKKWRGGGCA